MKYRELFDILKTVGKDPSRLIFEDDLTGINNRRFLLSFFEHKIRWDSAEDFPISLLMLDVDHFKETNDRHGHDAGDQVLQWLSSMMKQVGGERYVPIRYGGRGGGGEFVLLAPGADAKEGKALAGQLLQRAKEHPFQLRDVKTTLPISLSIGVTCAPDDASDGDGLIHRADAALYHGKNTGRGRAVSADEVDVKDVFPKTVLRRLKSSGVVGRDAALIAVSWALDEITQQKSRMVVFEGGPGMGKSTLLRAVGVEQERFRPYYLLTNILIALLSEQRGDGTAALASLTPKEITDLFVKLADSKPLVLLVDDLQFADESTLSLLRALLRRSDLPLLVCGATESLERVGKPHGLPFMRFCSKYRQELGIETIQLHPLGSDDVTSHLQRAFPGQDAPAELVRPLVSATRGNPLFLTEIIGKLELDQKVRLVGQQWAIEPLAEGYLPRSLDEIVSEKLEALNESSRDLLAHESTLGEDALSVLAGTSDTPERDGLEVLDQVEEITETELGAFFEVISDPSWKPSISGSGLPRRSDAVVHDHVQHRRSVVVERGPQCAPDFIDLGHTLRSDPHRCRQGRKVDRRIRKVHADKTVGAVLSADALLEDAVSAVVGDDIHHPQLQMRRGPERLDVVHRRAVTDNRHQRPVRYRKPNADGAGDGKADAATRQAVVAPGVAIRNELRQRAGRCQSLVDHDRVVW